MTSTVIRAGTPITGPPQPTAALTGAWPPDPPPPVDADGGLGRAERSEWSTDA